MLAGQNIAVDRLMKIVQAVRTGRMTGSLVATRGEGISYELGTLVFLNGRVVQGKVGRREGREALNWLLTWGKCCCNFVLPIMSDTDLRSERQFSNGETQLQSRIPHVRLVPLGQAQRPDRGKPYPHTAREESMTEGWSRGKLDQITQKEGKTLLVSVPSSRSRKDIDSPRLPGGKGYTPNPNESSGNALGALGQVNEIVPYIRKPREDGLQVLSEKGLSRMHRRVFLLVNGSRSVEDLMRLLKLNGYKTLALLYDLQDTGIINLSSPILQSYRF